MLACFWSSPADNFHGFSQWEIENKNWTNYAAHWNSDTFCWTADKGKYQFSLRIAWTSKSLSLASSGMVWSLVKNGPALGSNRCSDALHSSTYTGKNGNYFQHIEPKGGCIAIAAYILTALQHLLFEVADLPCLLDGLWSICLKIRFLAIHILSNGCMPAGYKLEISLNIISSSTYQI